MTTDCQHGFSAPALCPVCQHFARIAESEAVERKLRENKLAKLDKQYGYEDKDWWMDSDGPNDGG